VSIKVTPRSTTRRGSAIASLSSLGGPHTPGPVMRIAPKPICPTGNWVGVILVGTFDLLFRELTTGRAPLSGDEMGGDIAINAVRLQATATAGARDCA
jgi:hypothetical protein